MELLESTLPNGIRVVSLSGRLDMKSVLLIDVRFTALTATQSGGVIINMEHVDFLASIGIRLLVSNAKAVSSRGGQMAIAGAQPLVRETLVTSGIDQIIPLFDSQAEAEVALSR